MYLIYDCVGTPITVAATQEIANKIRKPGEYIKEINYVDTLPTCYYKVVSINTATNSIVVFGLKESDTFNSLKMSYISKASTKWVFYGESEDQVNSLIIENMQYLLEAVKSE